MTPRTNLLLGIGCLLAAQAVSTWVCVPQRTAITPNREVYEALTPGEFAGTLMLGGFRGLACDLLWMRAVSAKEEGRFYESVAVAEAITRIQPRFDQPWIYLSWDLAYNISHEVEDRDAKWSWVIAGLDTGLRGIQRNPQSERLLRQLAWMFNHKGDLFHDKIQAMDWSARLNPVIDEVNQRLEPAWRIEPLPAAAGLTNFAIAARLYRCSVALSDHALPGRGWAITPFVRRLVPLALENDGNIRRNAGQHLVALRAYLAALQAWEPVMAWATAQGPGSSQGCITSDSFERNEGRLRRKAAEYCVDLAPDPDTGRRAAEAIVNRRWDEAGQLLQRSGWKDVAAHNRIRWLDEPGGP